MLNELVIEATGKINYNNSLEKQEYEKKNYKAFLDKTNRAIGEIEILLDIAEEIEIISKSKQFNKIELSSSLEMCYKRIVSANPESSVIYKLDNSVKNFRNSLIEILVGLFGILTPFALNYELLKANRNVNQEYDEAISNIEKELNNTEVTK